MRVKLFLILGISLIGISQAAAQNQPIQTSISQYGSSRVQTASMQMPVSPTPDPAAQGVPLFQGGFSEPNQSLQDPVHAAPMPQPEAGLESISPQPIRVPQPESINVAPVMPRVVPHVTQPAPYVAPHVAPQYTPAPIQAGLQYQGAHQHSGACGCGCDAVGPGCGCEPTCGCEQSCEPGCGCEPSCGCDSGGIGSRLGLSLNRFSFNQGPSCGVDAGCGCDSCEPACGCDSCCDGGCGGAPWSNARGTLMGGGMFQNFFQSTNGQWIAGVGAYYVQPHWETNPSIGVSSTVGTTTTQSARQFDWDLKIAPIVFAGYEGNNGFGWQARYVFLDESVQDAYTPQAGQFGVTPLVMGQSLSVAAGEQIQATQSLEFQIIDLELSQAARMGCGGVKGTFGGRYFTIDQNYNASLATAPAQSLVSQHGFQGFGPTVSVEVDRYVGAWKLFGNFRQSVLFGDRDSRVNVNNGVGRINRTENNLAVVSQSEVEAGIRRDVQFAGFTPFIEAAVVGQYWTGVGNGANGNVFTSQRDQAMGLFGGRGAIGLNF